MRRTMDNKNLGLSPEARMFLMQHAEVEPWLAEDYSSFNYIPVVKHVRSERGILLYTYHADDGGEYVEQFQTTHVTSDGFIYFTCLHKNDKPIRKSLWRRHIIREILQQMDN